MRYGTLLICVLLVLAVSCTPTAIPTSLIAFATATKHIATATMTLTVTPTLKPTVAPTPTSTSTPVPTRTSTMTPTAVPTPTSTSTSVPTRTATMTPTQRPTPTEAPKPLALNVFKTIDLGSVNPSDLGTGRPVDGYYLGNPETGNGDHFEITNHPEFNGKVAHVIISGPSAATTNPDLVKAHGNKMHRPYLWIEKAPPFEEGSWAYEFSHQYASAPRLINSGWQGDPIYIQGFRLVVISSGFARNLAGQNEISRSARNDKRKS